MLSIIKNASVGGNVAKMTTTKTSSLLIHRATSSISTPGNTMLATSLAAYSIFSLSLAVVGLIII